MDDDFDTPWKEVVMHHFPEFMAFYFPLAHAAIDWSRPHTFLDQELAALSRDAALGKRVLDKLVRVHTHDCGEQWVLVHLEVQGRHDRAFAERMYVYNYRVYDRYRCPVASLALLADGSRAWRPSSFGWRLLGCELRLDFPVVKLRDFSDRIDELLTQENPFALVTVAHLLAMRSKGRDHWRRSAKWRLAKLLYQRNWSRQRIIDLYRVIDWIMRLPTGLDARLRHGLLLLERRSAMTYLSSMERIGMELGHQRGLEEGRQEGRKEGRQEAWFDLLSLLLRQRFGELDVNVVARLAAADVGELTNWARNFVTATSLQEVFRDQ